MASKLLLLPLIPALAFGIVEVASKIEIANKITLAPTAVAPIAPVAIVEHAAPAPVKTIEEPPAPVREPECRGCATSD